MEDRDIINLWKAQDAKIEQSLAINQQLLKTSIRNNTQSALHSLKKLKIRGVIALVPYLILLGWSLVYATIHYTSAANYFIASVSVIFLINIKALVDYIKHLIWIDNMDYDGSVTHIQQQLTRLQYSIIQHAKIMCLQFPFFTTLYLSDKWFPQDVGAGYIVFQVLLTGSFTYFSYWLYQNHTVENLDKKWFQRLIAGSGGKSVRKALAFNKELEAFKQES